ncbi:hypothetical protein AB0K93_24585 [Streptomyces sp. NPDC052676]|uniref:hypothetical protein n=1 Tax=Streptomyces sp. NPDC052676 TaxID=3154953 RepID=UPI0034280954
MTTQEKEFSGPLGSVTTGLLKFVGGASELTLVAASKDSEELYEGHFTGLVPEVEATGGVVTVRYPRRLHPFSVRRHSGRLTLHPTVPWAIEVDGGTGRLTADLTALTLTRLDLGSGASHVSLALPRPRGTVSIRVAGGVSNVSVRRPQDVAAHISITGGASQLTFDGQHLGAIGGGVTFASPTYDTSEDRYDIEVFGGASALTVDRS